MFTRGTKRGRDMNKLTKHPEKSWCEYRRVGFLPPIKLHKYLPYRGSPCYVLRLDRVHHSPS